MPSSSAAKRIMKGSQEQHNQQKEAQVYNFEEEKARIEQQAKAKAKKEQQKKEESIEQEMDKYYIKLAKVAQLVKDRDPALHSAIAMVSWHSLPSQTFEFMINDFKSKYERHELEKQKKIAALNQRMKEIKENKEGKGFFRTILKAFIPGKKGYNSRQKIMSFIYNPADMIFNSLWEENRLRTYFRLKKEKKYIDKNSEKTLKKIEGLSKYHDDIRSVLRQYGLNENQFLSIIEEFEKNGNPQALKYMSRVYPEIIKTYIKFVGEREKIMHNYIYPFLEMHGFNTKAKGYHV